MSKRTRRLLLLGLPATLIGCVIVAWLLWPHTAITRENAAKIRVGMTRAEVEALFGGPGRIDTSGPTEGDDGADEGEAERAIDQYVAARKRVEKAHQSQVGNVQHFWGSNHVAVFVVFDADQCVIDFAVRPLRRTNENPIDMIRRWLRL